MGHTESAACLLPGPSASWLPTPFPAPGTHSPAALSFCTPGSPHSQFVPSQGGLARSVASGSSLAPGILKLRRVVAVSPGAHLSLTWQGTLPAGLCLSLPLGLSQFPTCTAPLLSGIFPDPSRAAPLLSFSGCLDLGLHRGRTSWSLPGFCTPDGYSLLQSTFCSLNHSRDFFP